MSDGEVKINQVKELTLTVRAPSVVNLLISICHCLSAMVGKMMSVDALMDVCAVIEEAVYE
jgi:hypothetical protein